MPTKALRSKSPRLYVALLNHNDTLKVRLTDYEPWAFQIQQIVEQHGDLFDSEFESKLRCCELTVAYVRGAAQLQLVREDVFVGVACVAWEQSGAEWVWQKILKTRYRLHREPALPPAQVDRSKPLPARLPWAAIQLSPRFLQVWKKGHSRQEVCIAYNLLVAASCGILTFVRKLPKGKTPANIPAMADLQFKIDLPPLILPPLGPHNKPPYPDRIL